ncbi:MAG: hypothetical protein HUU22_15635 [Phycisphaerae bacterium]|nr:hypothetical protein [Phycisphaerae bacterium]NUQ47456.1 hypothetical protein [Phycisphaerae bacterium]
MSAVDDGSALLCPGCGYDLRGLAGPKCPECGAAFEPGRLISVVEEAREITRRLREAMLAAGFLWGVFIFAVICAVSFVRDAMPAFLILGSIVSVLFAAESLRHAWAAGRLFVRLRRHLSNADVQRLATHAYRFLAMLLLPLAAIVLGSWVFSLVS